MAADAESAISKGALRRIFNDDMVSEPVLQCVQVKPLGGPNGNANGPERFRVVFSDVTNFIQGMLMTQLNYLVNDGQLEKGHLVRLQQYQSNVVKGKKIIFVVACEVLTQYGVLERIGSPEPLEAKEAIKSEEPTQQPGNISSNGFYGTKQEPQSQQRALPTRSNEAHSSSFGNIFPIDSLSPYAHKWTIKARCTHKSEIKTWHNKNGEGKLFSVNLLDDSGEIRATGFKEQCDMLYDVFKEGNVYYITSCRVQMAKKQFSNVNHDYELTFERDTQVEKAEDEVNVPQVRYNFTTLADLQNVEKDSTVDMIGILQNVEEVSEIVGKTSGKPYSKREVTVVDNTGISCRLTLWGNTAESFAAPMESVVAFKGLKVSDFGGRSLSLLSSGSLNVDPDIDEAHKLKGWYDAHGRTDNFATQAQVVGTTAGTGRADKMKTITQVKDEQLGIREDGGTDYFNMKATVVYVRPENFSYPACSSEGCNKKVVEIDQGQWRCEKCDKTWPKPEYRYIMSVNVSDHTGQIWLSCFDDVGRLIMGCTANELQELKEQSEEGGDGKAFLTKVQDANYRAWIFNCRAKMDTFQDQQRIRYQVSSARPINFSTECAKLAETIKQYKLDDDQSMFVS